MFFFFNTYIKASITKISLGLCHLLGYSDQELIGQNLDYLLPDCIHKAHLEMLKKKIVVSKIGESQQKNLKKFNLCYKY